MLPKADERIVDYFYDSIPATNKNKIAFDEFENYFENETKEKISSIMQKIEIKMKQSSYSDLRSFLLSQGAPDELSREKLLTLFQQFGPYAHHEIYFLCS